MAYSDSLTAELAKLEGAINSTKGGAKGAINSGGKTLQVDRADVDAKKVIEAFKAGQFQAGDSNPLRGLLQQYTDLESSLKKESVAPTQEVTGNLSIDQSISGAKPFAESLFGEGKLGRVSETRSGDVADLIARRKANLEGLSSTENQAAQDQLFNNVNRDTQTSLRQLRGIQGASGMRGDAAVSQQVGVLGAGQNIKKDLERDLLLKNIEMKRAALGDFEASVGNAEMNERDAKTFNLGQIDKEKSGLVTTQFGLAGLAQAERASLRGLDAAKGVLNNAGIGTATSLLSQLRLR